MIHPRRLKGTSSNIARYYTVGDYYKKGADEHSEWGGAIAAELGLSGSVDHDRFKALLAGKVGDQQFGRHRAGGEIEHHPGWDFAVNAPKSVSIMALVAGDDRIVVAHERAVSSALTWLEEHAALRHRSDGEIVHETTGRLLFARFTEHASRELDPHLHTHVVVMNMTNRGAGEPMASLETRAMFAEQMTAGQVYRNALAHHVRELGYDIAFDPRRGLFEISGVPHALIRDMSQRAEQIDAHAREHGLAGQAARTKSFYETRRAKQKAGLDTLHEIWSERSASHAADLGEVRRGADVQGEAEIATDPVTARRAALFGIRQSETREAVNNFGRLVRTGLASHVGEVRLDDVRPLLEEHEQRLKLLRTKRQSGDQLLTRGRTSIQTVRLEIALSEHISLSLADAAPLGSKERIAASLEGATLNAAQRQALTAIATSSDRLVGLHGVAGAGKSTLVKELVAASDPGWSFVAVAPTSSAAANLGHVAGIESRTVARLLGTGGYDLTDRHVLVVDEAGQLGNRQAVRLLEISRETGARMILLGDNKQTGAIEQGKAFWLLQKLGLPTSQLVESVRQETRAMKAAVATARAGDYVASLSHLDKVVSGAGAEALAERMVDEWTRLKPENRATTNILVLENATRLIVNARIRETLKREGVVAAEDTRLQILTSAGMSNQEKRIARFYSGGQVVTFARDNGGIGIARDTEYRVLGVGRDGKGRQIVRLVDEHGRTVSWDPRLGRAAHINIFVADHRALSAGDRIQWRLATKALDLKNAERGTVEKIDGAHATIRWDREQRRQTIDLGTYKTWDHGYAETVYSAQSKTYARAYVLAPVNSGLVNGQNYYTAITRARYGVKLWTEDPERLADKLARRSGEKSSALEALGRLHRDSHRVRGLRDKGRLDHARSETMRERATRKAEREGSGDPLTGPRGLADLLAGRVRQTAERIDQYLRGLLDGGDHSPFPADCTGAPTPPSRSAPTQGPER